jgi:hypothetical protein
MGVITKQQAFAILRGNQMFLTNVGVYVPISTRWPGVKYADLFNSSGINLTNASATTPVYPYVPGSGDPGAHVFSLIQNNLTIEDASNGVFVPIVTNGGDINNNTLLQTFERNYHKTGAHLQKKLK